MFMVSSRGMIVNNEVISRLAIKQSEFCCSISLAKRNESSTLYSLDVKSLSFRTSKSIPSIIKERYGCQILKLIRKFEKVDFKFEKGTLDLDFLYYCRNNNLIPTFLKFKSANKLLANSDVYKSCQ